MQIPFLDLQRQYAFIQSKIDNAIRRVVGKQLFILGDELVNFENEFAKYLGARYAVGVNSGTDGLILALRAIGITKDDEVITPANSFMATTLAIVEVGATPIFVDCDPKTYEIDVAQVKAKISKKTKAILPVHLYGASCDMKSLMEIVKKNKIFLIEDACQAHGAMFGDKKLGTIGHLGVFSFYPGKNLGAYGDGGAITTNNKKLYQKLLMLRNYGMKRKYFHEKIGYNSRLDEIQAAILRVKLKYLDTWNKKRNNIASFYRKKLLYSPYQIIPNRSSSCYHLFVIESTHRDALMNFLQKKEIHTLIHYPVPIHLQPCFSYLGYKKGDFPVAERLANSIVSIPMYPELTKKELHYIVEQINIFEKRK